jgi:dihydroflavonol-4-reductase
LAFSLPWVGATQQRRTGYVGSHTVAALVEGGHEVRLLVRAVQRVALAVAPLGLQAADLDTVVGDVTDPAASIRA